MKREYKTEKDEGDHLKQLENMKYRDKSKVCCVLEGFEG